MRLLDFSSSGFRAGNSDCTKFRVWEPYSFPRSGYRLNVPRPLQQFFPNCWDRRWAPVQDPCIGCRLSGCRASSSSKQSILRRRKRAKGNLLEVAHSSARASRAKTQGHRCAQSDHKINDFSPYNPRARNLPLDNFGGFHRLFRVVLVYPCLIVITR